MSNVVPLPTAPSIDEKEINRNRFLNVSAIFKHTQEGHEVVLRRDGVEIKRFNRFSTQGEIGDTLNAPENANVTAAIVKGNSETPLRAFRSLPDLLAGKPRVPLYEPAPEPAPTRAPAQQQPEAEATANANDDVPWTDADIAPLTGDKPAPPPKPKEAKPVPVYKPDPKPDDDAGDEGQGDGGGEAPEVEGDPGSDEAKKRAKKRGDDILRSFNKDHCVVDEGGRVLVFKEVQDPLWNRTIWQRMLFADFERAHQNQFVMAYPKNGGDTPKAVTYAKHWLSHPNRRQYLGGVVFDPSHVGTNRPNVLNLWRGFAVVPKRGSWGRMQRHIKTIICCGDESHFHYLMGWMARMIQFPHLQGEVAVVLRGDLGTGKGILGNALLSLAGQHGMHISTPEHLVGKFNGHLRDCIYLFADEAFFAGDKAGIGTLKALITESRIAIEDKYMPAVQVQNRLHIFMCSNLGWVVPAAPGERRFFVLDVSSDRKDDLPYFEAIYKELDNGGRAAMLHDLMNYDLSNFNVRRVPETEALQDQKKRSLESQYQWWCDVLMRGYIHKSRIGLDDYFGRWHDFAATDLLYAAYLDYAKSHGYRYPIRREDFGKFMHEMKGAPHRPRTQQHVIGEVINHGGAELVYGDRPRGYRFGSLGEARDAFEVATRLRVEWPGDGDEGGDAAAQG